LIRALILFFFPIFAFAGTNTLTNVVGGTVLTTHANQYFTALTGDLVSRNSAGVAVAEGGDLGTSTFPWKSLFLGTTTTTFSFTEDGSGNVSIKVNGVEALSVTPTGVDGEDIAIQTIPRNRLVDLGQQLSSSSGAFTSTNTSFVDVTNLSVSITTNGNPVFLQIIGGETAVSTWVGVQTASDVSANECRWRFTRGGSDISGSMRIRVELDVSTSKPQFKMPPSVLSFVDTDGGGGLAAATYTYKLQVQSVSSTTCEVERVKLVAYEL